MPDTPAPEFDAAKSIGTIRREYDMVVYTAKLVQPKLTSSGSDDEFVIAIALIESFLVHARALDEFLSSKGPHPTDVKASDFVPGFSEQPLDRKVRESINREMQHITVYRQVLQMEWVPLTFLPPIVESMGRFMEELDDDLAERLSLVHQRAVEAVADATK